MNEVSPEYFTPFIHEHVWQRIGQIRVGQAEVHLQICAVPGCSRTSVEEPEWDRFSQTDRWLLEGLMVEAGDIAMKYARRKLFGTIPHLE